MKSPALVAHFSLLKSVPKTLGTSNATSHSINYHHYRLVTQMFTTKDFVQLVCNKYDNSDSSHSHHLKSHRAVFLNTVLVQLTE